MSSVAVATPPRRTPPRPHPYPPTPPPLSPSGEAAAPPGGSRRVAVAVLGQGGAVRQDWTVRVRAPQPPRIADTFPASPSVDALVGGAIRLGVTARAATPHERLRLTWTVDGTVAGKQETITVQPKVPGMMVIRAVVASNLGAAASREWRINVLPPSVPAPADTTPSPPPH